MQAHDAISKMVPPSQRRRGIMRGGIIQIMLTRACNLSCHHCTAGSNLTGRPMMMTVDQFSQACDSLRSYWGVVACFGGNPCLHKDFPAICEVMRSKFQKDQCGLWTNNLNGHGAHARATFSEKHSNFNLHLDHDAAQEFHRDWPAAVPYLKGIDKDSVHTSPWVAMKDVIPNEETRWELISKCDINQNWSALIGVFRGKLRAWFCEIAAHQSMLHESNPDWDGTGEPIEDTGVAVVDGWWKSGMEAFAHQVRTHCHSCGIPMRRPGQMAIGGDHEEHSPTHEWIARPKVKGREIQVVKIGCPDTVVPDRPATEYLEGVTPVRRA